MSKENKLVSAVYLVNLCSDYLASYVASEQNYDDLDSPVHVDYNYYLDELHDALQDVNEYGVDIDL